MKRVAIDIPVQVLIKDYEELKSSYKVAEKYGISATAVKRLLKEAGALRAQNVAAKERTNPSNLGYKRTKEHLARLSEIAKSRTGSKNPFFGKKHSDKTRKILAEKNGYNFGENNPNYKHGKSKKDYEDEKQVKLHDYIRLKNVAFNRDKKTCFYCKDNKSGHLHAHHAIPFWVSPEAYLDIDNLVTVCTECHFTKAHRSNWHCFDPTLISVELQQRYSLSSERLNELAVWYITKQTDAIVRPSDINKTEEVSENSEKPSEDISE